MFRTTSLARAFSDRPIRITVPSENNAASAAQTRLIDYLEKRDDDTRMKDQRLYELYKSRNTNKVRNISPRFPSLSTTRPVQKYGGRYQRTGTP